jgi:hypothetical protein
MANALLLTVSFIVVACYLLFFKGVSQPFQFILVCGSLSGFLVLLGAHLRQLFARS